MITTPSTSTSPTDLGAPSAPVDLGAPTSPTENQTQFMEDKVFWSDTETLPPVPGSIPPPKSSRKVWYIVLVAVGLLLFSLLLLAAAKKKRSSLEPSPTPTVTAATPTASDSGNLRPVERALRDLNSEMSVDDPFANDLPFPPINFDLSIGKANLIQSGQQ